MKSIRRFFAYWWQELRWAIMEFEADRSPIASKEYTDVKELIADLKKESSEDSNKGVK